MNDRLLEIISLRPDFSVSPEDKKFLDFFVEYLDHGSLFLSGFTPGENPAFTFTNDAQRYRFDMAQIRGHVQSLKQGRAMDWDNMPFEYVNEVQQ